MLTLDDLRRLADRFQDALKFEVRDFDIGGQAFRFNSHPALMGVVNLSPDSWYRESVCLQTEQCIQRGRRLSLEGADLVDLGAESSILDAARVDAESQLQRLLPAIRGLVQEKILVSTETYHPAVAKACLEAGASVLNFTGNARTPEVFQMVAERNAAMILCYVEGSDVRSVGDFMIEGDPVPRMKEYFARRIEEATRLGITRILIDPGLGFYYRNLQDSATRVRHQMHVFLHTFRLRELGWPICQALPHAFEYFGDEVRSAEPFFAVLALLGKTNLLRTHEVAKVKAVCRTLEIWQS